jgi:hypothetical protein
LHARPRRGLDFRCRATGRFHGRQRARFLAQNYQQRFRCVHPVTGHLPHAERRLFLIRRVGRPHAQWRLTNGIKQKLARSPCR